jgi:Domain of unknown function (DUF5666)
MNNTQNQTPIIPPRRTIKSKKKIYSAIGGVALALAVALGGNAMFSSNQVANAQTATTTPTANPNQKPAPGVRDGRHGMGRGGTISAIDATSMTLTRPDNTTVKVTLTATTVYQNLDKTVTIADFKVGTKVNVKGTPNADGTVTATEVSVHYDHLGGTITAISGSNITVQINGRGNKGAPPSSGTTPPATATPTTTPVTKTITVSGSTVFTEGGQTVQLAALAVGEKVNAVGNLSTDGNTLTALQVKVEQPHYHGSVTAVSGSTITIQDRNTTRTIEVNGNTKYLNGTATAALTDVVAGVRITAEGTVDASGKLTASVIQLGQGQGGGKGGPGGGRR